MVMARSHLICGNCGCNDDFEYSHRAEVTEGRHTIEPEDVSITCRNCGTIHSLDDNAEIKEQE